MVRTRFDDLQRAWLAEVDGLTSGTAIGEEWDGLTERCTADALRAANALLAELRGEK
jgi:hypothetical protein